MKKLSLALALALAVPSLAPAQGRTDYYNPESIQVDPIAVIEVGGRQYVAAVNTPDNSVEIYHTVESADIGDRFVTRVRTGLEPVSLLWVAELGRLYVANALSDGVTSIILSAGSDAGLVATVDRTEWVYDEPVALAYLPFDEDDGDGGTITRHSLVVAHRDEDAFSWIDALTLQVIGPGTRVLDAAVQKGDVDQDGQDDFIAIKSPRDIEVRCGRVFILGEKGGGTEHYDFDVYSIPTIGGTTRDIAIPNTTNYNMAFAGNDDLFIVGGHGLNDELRDEQEYVAAPTGFVVATLTMVRGACGDDPMFKQRDVNLRPGPIVQVDLVRTFGGTSGPLVPVLAAGPSRTASADLVAAPIMMPVPKNKAMTQLTSVVVFEPHDGPTKVYFTAFGNDWLGVARPSWDQSPNSWPVNRIRIKRVPGSTNPMAGPRGLALKPANPSDNLDPGARLYVLNRLDNAITVVDPVTDQRLYEFPLQHDPTPLYIRKGRKFLYDARLGNGFNACATCHIDGRTDGLAWDLGDGMSPAIPANLKDNLSVQATSWPADKNFMVTQTLQGLLNWEVDPEIQDLVTNAPYHWRADREDFTKFNPAFEGLLGGMELDPDDMDDFEEFINSVHYPPNPRQPLNRDYSGIEFDGDFPTELPTDAQAGMFIFHVFQSVGTISCAHCHALPEGSENKIPLVLQFHSPFDPEGDPQGGQPVEAAAMRGLNQRVARVERSGLVPPENAAISGLEGLSHTGFLQKDPLLIENDFNRVASINSFMRHFFSGVVGCGLNGFCEGVSAIAQFTHEFDTGTAPAVGFPYTVDDTNNTDTGLTKTALDIFEAQTQDANAGLAVQAWIGGLDRGFVYDPRNDRYVEELGSDVLARVELLAKVAATRDRLVFIATPLGSERRVGSPTGQIPPSPPGGVPPTDITLHPMAPNSAYDNVPLLTFNWFDPAPNPDPDPQHGGFFAHTVRLFQMGVIDTGPIGDDFGVAKRWEPSRRFRVAVNGVGINARLELYVHDDEDQPLTPPNTSLPPEGDGQVETRVISLPIHPTGETDAETGAPIYESSAELDAREFLRLMLGGENHPAVVATLNDNQFLFEEDPLDPGLAFDADGFNWLFVRVIGENGIPGDGGWQRLRLE